MGSIEDDVLPVIKILQRAIYMWSSRASSPDSIRKPRKISQHLVPDSGLNKLISDAITTDTEGRERTSSECNWQPPLVLVHE
jgi:hypothetical protein